MSIYLISPRAQLIGTLSEKFPPISSAAYIYIFLEGTLKIFFRILVSTRACHWAIIAGCTSHARKVGSIPRQRTIQYFEKDLFVLILAV